MTTTPVSEYAAAVRAALSDVPETDRSELLEDLEDHLTEVAGESDEPLETRLGTPESYAAELYAAYLQRPDQQPAEKKKRNVFRAVDTRVAAFNARVNERFPGYEKTRDDFRPAWWLLRGYLIAFAFWGFESGRLHPIPWNTFEWLVLAVIVIASVALGYRVRDGRRSRPLNLVSLVAGLVACFVAFAVLVVSDKNGDESYVYSPVDYQPHSDLANIYPYTKDGKPLEGVLLYDQYGRPIQVGYEQYGYQQIPGAAPQIPNSYPLPICNPERYMMEESLLIPHCADPNSEAFPGPSTSQAPPIPSTPPGGPASDGPSESPEGSPSQGPDPSAPAPADTPSPAGTPPSAPATPESSPTE
ncbi:HAAS signaling domain-containing protein [Actinocorallia populi]|uniref:HAAS signaling domain-containing protein n=1 Tax=Actinocorallia populi TaxID=2079200 RepID=UPI000D0920DC|nr:hypothetical protein [Actinocorallia populi]